MDGPNLGGTLKVTGAKTMFLLARGRFSRIWSYTLMRAHGLRHWVQLARKTLSKGLCGLHMQLMVKHVTSIRAHICVVFSLHLFYYSGVGFVFFFLHKMYF